MQSFLHKAVHLRFRQGMKSAAVSIREHSRVAQTMRGQGPLKHDQRSLYFHATTVALSVSLTLVDCQPVSEPFVLRLQPQGTAETAVSVNNIVNYKTSVEFNDVAYTNVSSDLLSSWSLQRQYLCFLSGSESLYGNL